jgi:hypothetical protein
MNALCIDVMAFSARQSTRNAIIPFAITLLSMLATRSLANIAVRVFRWPILLLLFEGTCFTPHDDAL